MIWIYAFLVELGVAIALVATGYHWSFALGPAVGALLVALLAFAVFIIDEPTGFPKLGEQALVALFVGGLGGVYGAPVALVLTGLWSTTAAVFGVGIGMFFLMFFSGIIADLIQERRRKARLRNET